MLHFKAMEKKSRIRNRIVEVVFLVAAVIGVFVYLNFFGPGAAPHAMDITDIPPYEKYSYVIINNDEPLFDASEMVPQSYEFYSELDALGRCGYAIACLGKETMPTEERESINSVKPSGWVQAQYDFVDGGMLYNYPINLFDAISPIDKTIGFYFKSTPNPATIKNLVEFISATLSCTGGVQQELFTSNPKNIKRSICIETSDVPSLNFNITTGDSTFNFLYEQGYRATELYFSLLKSN